MKIARRTGAAAVGLSLATVLLLGARPLRAEEPAPTQPPTKTTTVARRTYDPSRRVPAHFGAIGLTPDQKESIYKIRSRHQQKIDDLDQQIRQVKAQMLAECEGLLTDTQKQLLEHRRRAAGQARKSRAPSPAANEPARETKQ